MQNLPEPATHPPAAASSAETSPAAEPKPKPKAAPLGGDALSALGDLPVADLAHPQALAHVRQHLRAWVASEQLRELDLALADFVGSTSGIIDYAGKMSGNELIFGTELGILYQLRTRYPAKTFIPASEKMICETMKLTTLEDILKALTAMAPAVKVPEAIRAPAKRCLDRMLAVG